MEEQPINLHNLVDFIFAISATYAIVVLVLTILAALAESVIGITGPLVLMFANLIITVVFVCSGDFIGLALSLPLIALMMITISMAISFVLKIQSDSIFSAYFGAIFDIM